MNIKLNKPLIFLALEATDLSIGSERIVEICLLKLNIDNSTEIKTQRINPQMPIPDVVSKIHGIYDIDDQFGWFSSGTGFKPFLCNSFRSTSVLGGKLFRGIRRRWQRVAN